jgi:hypothetical protein
MPVVDAVIFTKWIKDTEGGHVPNAIADIYAWAIANGELVPSIGPNAYGRYKDVTGQLAPTILADKVFCARLEVSPVTAQQFSSDPRIWTLGRKIIDDEGNVTDSNWDTPLTAPERTQALDWLEAHGIDRATVAARFSASDTRKQIADKLVEFFKE